jgi:3-hydroxybutyryl-CoA dehydrogenase
VSALTERALRPERFLVTHYFNPAQLVPLVEVLPHPLAPPAIVGRALELLRGLGKRPVLLRREVPGFVANRLQAALAREAFHLVEEGAVTPNDLDAVVTEGPGVRWPFLGPLAPSPTSTRSADGRRSGTRRSSRQDETAGSLRECAD